MPAERGLPPGVEEKAFTKQDRTDRLLKAISGQGDDAVLVHQDAAVYLSSTNPGTKLEHAFDAGHGAYLYVIEGALRLNDEKLETGDAAKISDEPAITLEAEAPTELLMVEVRVT